MVCELKVKNPCWLSAACHFLFVQVAEVHQALAPHLGDRLEIQCVTDDQVRPSDLLNTLFLCAAVRFDRLFSLKSVI